ncbi:DUF397 domain-containing protein [Streptomyces sp. NPDC093109]|uniref:DUF397 domain-containing protein n=1 Tax=Streptomyces sp. NPDC093109 TaxID=3154977 RepID=UPI00344EB7E0
MTKTPGLTSIDWFKSSYCNDHVGDCVEGGLLADGAMAVRDSKVPAGPALVLAGASWAAFVDALGEGGLNAK